MRRVRIVIKGRVQGVFFRHSTRLVARQLGVKGLVRNLADGSVEVVAEGENGAISKLIDFCMEGSEGASVSSIDVKEEPYEGRLNGFDVRY